MSDPFIGEIRALPYTYAPKNWAFCEGQQLNISEHNVLYAVLGTTFGGNGTTNFKLPDLKGRSIVHPGHGLGLQDTVFNGQMGGYDYIPLSVQNLPAHNHTATLYAEGEAASAANPKDKMLATATTYAPPTTSANKAMAEDSIVVDDTGSSTPVYNRSPFLGINYCIALEGIFPSRN